VPSPLAETTAAKARLNFLAALLIICIALTIACALAFLVIKYIEYSHKIHEQLLPGRYFDPCVSSSGVPLLTRSNHCPGSKSSVEWDYTKADAKNISLVEGSQLGAPVEGCFAEDELDMHPEQQGIQADCTVDEVQVEEKKIEQPPVKDKDGKETKVAPKVEWIEKSKKPITAVCPDPVAEVLAHHAPKPAAGSAPAPHAEAKKYPCWRLAVQPAVCRPNYYYTQWCTDKNCLAPDPTPNAPYSATNVFPAKAGQTFKSIGPFTSKKKCEEQQSANGGAVRKLRLAELEPQIKPKLEPIEKQIKELKAKLDEAKKAGAPVDELTTQLEPLEKEQKELQGRLDKAKADPIGTLSPCRVQQPVGFIVEYGDHEHRGHTTRIKATCKTPAAPVAKADVDAFKDKVDKVAPGKKQEGERELTTHEIHDLEAAGPPPPNTGMFFTIYFAMTGLHGIHVLFGVFVFVWLLIRAIKGQFTPDYFGPIDFAALYWHIVDLIWIFLFPLLYLIH
jgi:hypothetical protein